MSDWRENLYTRKAAELILYGRALGLSHGEAEDVLQETFLALLQKPEPPVTAGTLLRAQLPEPRAELPALPVAAADAGTGVAAAGLKKARRKIPPERAAMRCLEKLPVEQREVIVLKIWHRYTFEEIGGLLDISPNTAAGRYRYGLQKIKLCLERTTYERDELAGEPIEFLETTPTLGEN